MPSDDSKEENETYFLREIVQNDEEKESHKKHNIVNKVLYEDSEEENEAYSLHDSSNGSVFLEDSSDDIDMSEVEVR